MKAIYIKDEQEQDSQYTDLRMVLELQFDPDQDRASEAVVRAIAKIEGKQVTEVEPVLYESIDTEALDSLVGHEGVQIDFTHSGYQIGIEASGTISVANQETEDR